MPAEIEANDAKVQELANERGLKVAQNVAAGVTGIIVWPVLFAMDFKGAADQNLAAPTTGAADIIAPNASSGSEHQCSGLYSIPLVQNICQVSAKTQ